MFSIRQSPHLKPLLQLGIGAPDSNRVGAADSRYPAMSALNTQRSLPDSKLESGEEQGPSGFTKQS
jgi:hypothetical protein